MKTATSPDHIEQQRYLALKHESSVASSSKQTSQLPDRAVPSHKCNGKVDHKASQVNALEYKFRPTLIPVLKTGDLNAIRIAQNEQGRKTLMHALFGGGAAQSSEGLYSSSPSSPTRHD